MSTPLATQRDKDLFYGKGAGENTPVAVTGVLKSNARAVIPLLPQRLRFRCGLDRPLNAPELDHNDFPLVAAQQQTPSTTNSLFSVAISCTTISRKRRRYEPGRVSPTRRSPHMGFGLMLSSHQYILVFYPQLSSWMSVRCRVGLNISPS